MQVLLLSDLYPPVVGGLEVHVDALAGYLARQGHQVTVGTLTEAPTPAEPKVDVVTLKSAVTLLPHEDPTRPFHPPLADPVTGRSLRTLIDRVRPDIIHAHSAILASVPRSARAPVIFTAHDYGAICCIRTLLHQPEGSLCSGPRLNKCYGCSSHRYRRPVAAAMSLATAYRTERFPASHVVAVSSAVRAELQRHIGSPMTVIPNFLPPEPEREALPNCFPAERFVLYVGADGAHKGVPSLIDVWRGEGDDLPPLVLATPRPVQYPLPPRVVNVSLTPGQVATAWDRAAVGVIPSWWQDPCPTVALEAMRAGTPTVASRVGGIPDLIRDGIDGVLVPPRDVDALMREIRSLLRDPARADRIGAAARERARHFAVEVIGTRVEDLYGELMSSPVRRGEPQ